MNKEFNTKQKIKIEKLMNKQKFKQSSRKIVENKDTNNNVQRKIVSALSEFNDKLNDFLGELLTDMEGVAWQFWTEVIYKILLAIKS